MKLNQTLRVVFGIAILIIAAVLLTHNREITSHLVPYFYKPIPADLGPQLGTILEVRGNVVHRMPSEATVTPAKDGDVVFENSLWQSPRGASFKIRFANSYELEFSENSRVVIELWKRDTPNSPVLLSLLSGDFQTLHEGAPSQVLILQNGRLFTPQTKDQKKAQTVLISPHLVAGWNERGPQSVETPAATAAAAAMAANEDDEHAPKLPTPSRLLTSLSNEYMDEVLAGQRTRFSRCQANAIRSKTHAKGDMVIGFRISPDGKTQESKVLNSTIGDSGFQNCILEVISSLRFNEFSGPDIIRSFEMKFE